MRKTTTQCVREMIRIVHKQATSVELDAAISEVEAAMARVSEARSKCGLHNNRKRLSPELVRAIAESTDNVSETARRLCLSRPTVIKYRKMTKAT